MTDVFDDEATLAEEQEMLLALAMEESEKKQRFSQYKGISEADKDTDELLKQGSVAPPANATGNASVNATVDTDISKDNYENNTSDNANGKYSITNGQKSGAEMEGDLTTKLESKPSTVKLQQLSQSVTTDRKNQLLCQARINRLAWIQSVPLPFCSTFQTDTNPPKQHSQHHSKREHLRLLPYSHAGLELPSALRLLSFFSPENPPPYPDDWKPTEEEFVLAVPSGEQLLQAELDRTDKNRRINTSSACGTSSHSKMYAEDGDNTRHILTLYQSFLNHLQQPECTMLVQGMRNFVRSFRNLHDEHKRTSTIVTALKTYLDKTHEHIQSHPAWNNILSLAPPVPRESNDNANIRHNLLSDPNSSIVVRRSLESFVYGQVHDIVWKIMLKDTEQEESENNGDSKDECKDDATNVENEWMERINSLQFVSPDHLEITCLSSSNSEKNNSSNDSQDDGDDRKINDDNDDNDDGDLSVDERLSSPIEALLSIHQYYSPYEKLQRILAVYHGANAALTAALNKCTKGDSNENKKLPSADDILPTLILIVLRAKPEHMITNLKFIEVFCSPEQLRGEAGYAFTNLYGAVHFLKELNLNPNETTNSNGTLLISPQNFRKGLEQCRAKTNIANERFKSMSPFSKGAATSVTNDKDAATLKQLQLSQPSTSLSQIEIPIAQVRAARLRGEQVNLQWALQWQHDNIDCNMNTHGSVAATTGAAPERLPAVQRETIVNITRGEKEDLGHSDTLPESLPKGFSRAYSFLATRPEDVRVAELPQLLAEYRMLVHSTEILLGERTTRIATERKQRAKEARKVLEETAATVNLDM